MVFLPYRPIPIGFAVNTALYASLWALLFIAVASMRKRFRVRRHLCPHCAYDLSGTGAGMVCPECGEVAEPRGAESQEPTTHN